MLFHDQRLIQACMDDLAAISRRFRAAAYLLPILALAGGGCYFAQAIGDVGRYSNNPTFICGNAVLGATIVVTGFVVSVVVAQLLLGFGVEDSLFTSKQVVRLSAIGILLLIFAVLEMVGALGLPIIARSAGLAVEPNPSTQLVVLFTDILFIVAAIVSFHLSYTFKYCYFLQCFYNETV